MQIIKMIIIVKQNTGQITQNSVFKVKIRSNRLNINGKWDINIVSGLD